MHDCADTAKVQCMPAEALGLGNLIHSRRRAINCHSKRNCHTSRCPQFTCSSISYV